MKEFLKVPNLLSLSRIFLAIPIFLLLKTPGNRSTIEALVLMVVAAITDGLDGFLARKLHQVGRLGIALDPIADKLFAASIVVALILYRGFPLWLAAIIVGRDLVILAAGSILLRGRDISLPSNLTGKYAFASIAVLLSSYVIQFRFGILMTTVSSLVLIIGSLVSYARVFAFVRSGKEPPRFRDSVKGRFFRIGLTLAFSALFLVKLYSEMLRQ